MDDSHKASLYLTTGTLEKKSPLAPKTSFIQEIDHAVHLHGKASDLVRGFMEDMQLCRAINVAIAKKVVTECVDTDALLWMTQLKRKDVYTAQHSMNMCILGIIASGT